MVMHSVMHMNLQILLKIARVSVTSQTKTMNQKKKMTLPSSVCVAFHLFMSYKHPETMIDHMSKKWDAPVYVFFKPSATIKYVGKCKAHVFEFGAAHCHCKSKFVQWFLYTGDASSTSNMCRHAKICWGDEAITAADTTGNI
jgi:hypothetical protein